MYNLIVAVGDRRLRHEVFKHRAVLHLAQAEHRETVGRVELVVAVGPDGGDAVCHVLKLGEVFLGVPCVLAIREELLIVLVGVVYRIIKILKVIESYKPHLVLLLGNNVTE